MKFRSLLLGALFLLHGYANAFVGQFTFSGTTEFVMDGFDYPAAGTPISGSALFDFDLSRLDVYAPPAYPTTASYSPTGAAFLPTNPSFMFSVHIGPLAIVSPLAGLDIFDNGSPYPFDQARIPTDGIFLGTKRSNVYYGLLMLGPNDSFSGVGLPSLATLQNFHTSASFFVFDYNSNVAEPVYRANIASVTVSAVPEPQTWATLLAGGVLLIAIGSMRRRSPLVPVA